ncbi:MAG TPA: cytochrome c nitrite reductase small subunit [Polyangiaceae bacterium]|nr:cytochrome c nitrite reductase small subunit [Polyangiaceae bacterium]
MKSGPRFASWWFVALAIAVGALAGVGGYTFRYAEGLSYLKTDPRACRNCHIMQSEYDAWQKSSHHTVAVCVDCHLPHSFFAKYWTKAENGWRHGKLFTTGGFEEPITIKSHGLEVLQENCLRCHGPLVEEAFGSLEAPRVTSGHAAKSDLTCIHCHFTVGHGERGGLGGPASELERSSDERKEAKTP